MPPLAQRPEGSSNPRTEETTPSAQRPEGSSDRRTEGTPPSGQQPEDQRQRPKNVEDRGFDRGTKTREAEETSGGLRSQTKAEQALDEGLRAKPLPEDLVVFGGC